MGRMYTLSSPIITSSINLHFPNLTFSGLPNVDTISPPVSTKCYNICEPRLQKSTMLAQNTSHSIFINIFTSKWSIYIL